MKSLLAAALLAASIIPAAADVYVRSPWGFVPVLPTGPYAYGPGRIPPGFRAPPAYNPYARTIAEQFGPPPPSAPAPAPLPPPPAYAPPPPPPPLGWIFGPYTACTDPPACTAIFVSVGADGVNVRTVPDGPTILALANGTPVIPIQQSGKWLLVAAACPLAPTWTISVTTGVPLSVCF